MVMVGNLKCWNLPVCILRGCQLSLMNLGSDFYSYGWWITTVGGFEVFYMRGFLGQYVAIVPDKNIIVVRLGKKEEKSGGEVAPPHSFNVFMNEILTKY